MPLQKSITTPAGNVLGTYGVVTQAHVLATSEGMTLVGCTLLLYATAASHTAAVPAVAIYRYGLKLPFKATDDALSAAETGLLNVADSGTFVTAGVQPNQGSRAWVPGWVGSTVVAEPTKA